MRVEGRTIARTFWGKAWGENLEAYSDYVNRLPRGRSYLRNGSVVDLQIERGRVTALVSGSDLYEIHVTIKPLPAVRWKTLVDASAGQMLSMVDLLAGTFSEQVMKRFCDRTGGLFPAPTEITLTCSCPDWADMCKHVAATLYGVGARLDARPELLFTLRGVDPLDLLAAAGAEPAKVRAPKAGKVLDTNGLGAIFGIELGQMPTSVGERKPRPLARETSARAEAGTTKAKVSVPASARGSTNPASRREAEDAKVNARPRTSTTRTAGTVAAGSSSRASIHPSVHPSVNATPRVEPPAAKRSLAREVAPTQRRQRRASR